MDEWFEGDWLAEAGAWMAGAIASFDAGRKKSGPRRLKWARRRVRSSGTEDEAKVRAAKRKTGNR